MVAEGLWLSRKQRRTFHQPRLRRESYGELIQIDGSEHRWFEQRGEPCTLLVFIDDATSRLMQLRFVPSESTDPTSKPGGYLETHGCPVAFYSDKHSVFRVNRADAKGGSGMTQFGRALAELNIEIICANSSQAKGRVERANRTLQDRLVKELRMAESVTSTPATRSSRLHGALQRAVRGSAAKTEDLHRTSTCTIPGSRHPVPPRAAPRRRAAHPGLRPQADHPGTQRGQRSWRPVCRYLRLRDGRLEVRSKGLVLPYRIFNKDQRVNPTAIVENKRLSHALAIIKAQQDLSKLPGKNQQRKERLPETNAHSECAAARAQRCPEFVTSV